MQQVLLLSFPFFALVFCGYAAARVRLLPLDAIPGLNVFVLYFALPCMLFRFGANTPIKRLLDGSAFVTYLVCAVVMVAITVLVARRRSVNWNDAAFGALVAAFPNTGFMGVPLLTSLAGEKGIAPVIVSLAIDMIITTSLCIALSRIHSGGAGQSSTALVNALKGVFRNPLPWAIVLGGMASYAGINFYKPVIQIVDLLANSGSPTALFTIGAVLARPHASTKSGNKTARPGDVAQIDFFKLVLHPALVFFVGKAAIRLGVPLDASSLTMLTLVAALPSASSITMLSERFQADTGRVARIILFTTALAFFSFSAAVSLLM